MIESNNENISVIIRVKNEEQWIGHAIQSILDNIDLTDQAPIYENKIEKIVYNVGNDLSSTATDGIDVLRNAPLVSVDIEDNVSIRGSENIKFLLN